MMSFSVTQNTNRIDSDTRSLISQRYHTITKSLNKEFWNSGSDTTHSLYVGSYGRGTAISTSDIDILLELPKNEYNRYDTLKGNGQSRLIQAVKESILSRYPNTDIHGNGQVVVVKFSDGMKLELLPAFKHTGIWGDVMYIYPDSNMGGNWRSTNPKKEQETMKNKNKPEESNGLFFDTCKQIRYVRNKCFSSYHLSGIVIDTFVYNNIGFWHWLRESESKSNNTITFEETMLNQFNSETVNGTFSPVWQAPGSGMEVNTKDSIECLGKVWQKMAEE